MQFANDAGAVAEKPFALTAYQACLYGQGNAHQQMSVAGQLILANGEIGRLRAILRALDHPHIFGTAESCASGMGPRWDFVSGVIATARAAIVAGAA